MDSFVLYKHAKSARTRNYPTLVSKSLISVEHAPTGKCQNAGCVADCDYLRVWLCPDNHGRVTVANLNGVRYCATHAREFAEQTGMPLLATAADLTAYHSQILDLESAGSLDGVISQERTPSVKVVAKNGTVERFSDGSLICTLNDGSKVHACCHAVAAKLVGLTTSNAECLRRDCKRVDEAVNLGSPSRR